jgi:hypothetical protein
MANNRKLDKNMDMKRNGKDSDMLDNRQGNDARAGNGNPTKGKQGFASMDAEKARQIQSMGGRASHGGGRSSNSENARREASNMEREMGREQRPDTGRKSGAH